MNIYFVGKDGTLITPPVSGTILEGITRARSSPWPPSWA